jgi:hypothetical protein
MSAVNSHPTKMDLLKATTGSGGGGTVAVFRVDMLGLELALH